jgi:hypothetical protein
MHSICQYLQLPKRAEGSDEDEGGLDSWGNGYEGNKRNRVTLQPAAQGDSSSEESSSEEEEQQDWFELFPDLHRFIEAAVRELGGQVIGLFPALIAVP